MKYVDVVSKSPELKWTEHHQQKNKTEKFSNWMIKRRKFSWVFLVLRRILIIIVSFFEK